MIHDSTMQVASTSEEYPLTDAEVSDHLALYREEYQYVTRAHLAGFELRCLLVPAVYPQSNAAAFHYVPATLATLYISQLFYTLVGALAVRNMASVKILPDREAFTRLRDAGCLQFAKMSVSFRREIQMGHAVDASIVVRALREHDDYLVCSAYASLADAYTADIVAIARRTR